MSAARWWRRAVLALGLGAVLCLLGATPALAHASLASSDPADGAILDAAPPQVSIVFTEPPDPELSSIEVIDAGGRDVTAGPARPGPAPRSLVVALRADLPDGTYTASWDVVSEADGHRTANAFAFGVGVEPTPAPSAGTAEVSGPTPLSVAGRAGLYLGIVLAIGLALAASWTIGPDLPGRRAVALLAGIAALAGAAIMTLAERDTLGVSLGTLLDSTTGRSYRWLMVTSGVVLAAGIVTARTRGRAGPLLLGAAGIAAAAVRAAGGHAAAADPAWPQELVQTVHITAAGVWIGGFVPILALLRARTRVSRTLPVDAVRRFSRAAGWAVAVVVLTGVVRVVNEAGGPRAVRALLFDTRYGTVLTVKIALVVAIVALGALNRRRSIPRMGAGDRLLGRVVATEAVAAVAVLVATAILTGLSPTVGPTGGADAPTAVHVTGADFATTMRVSLTATPGLPGPNDFLVDVTDYDSDRPIEASDVSLRFDPVGRPGVNASQLGLTSSGAGAWTGTGSQLSLAGVWQITVTVETGPRGTEIPLTLVTGTPPGVRTETTQQGTLPAITTITVPGGEQIQGYLDEAAGEVHVTAFDAAGQELPLDDVVIVATPAAGRETGEPRALDPARFGAGHFTAEAPTVPGRWRFDVVAIREDGGVLQGSFERER